MAQFLDLIDEMLAHRKAQKEGGYTFPLTASSLGGAGFEIHVRRVALIDRASLNQLPEHLQSIVWDGLTELRAMNDKRRKTGQTQATSLEEELRDNEVVLKAANAFMEVSLLGLVKGDREQPVTGPSLRKALDAISDEDKLAFYLASTDAESEQAAKLKIFRPQSQVVIQDDAPGATAAPTQRDLGPESGGVYQPATPGL